MRLNKEVYLGTGLLLTILSYALVGIDYHYFRLVLFTNRKDVFMDFFNCIYSYYGNPYMELRDWGSNYPALAALFFKICHRIIPGVFLQDGPYALRESQIPCLMFAYWNAVIIMIICYALYHKVNMPKRQKLLLYALILLSFPVTFAFERGNIINLAFALTFFFCTFYDDESKYRREMALLALAIAVALKIYPIVFSVVLLKRKPLQRRHFFEMVRFVVYMLVCFFVPFFYYGGWKAIKGFVQGMVGFSNSKTGLEHDRFGRWIVPTDYSINFSLKNICRVLEEILHIGVSDSINTFFFVLAIGIILFLILFTQTKWKVFLGCALLVTIVPSVSGAYVLIFMLIPFIEMLQEPREEIYESIDGIYLLLFLGLMIPWSFPDITMFYRDANGGILTGGRLVYFLCIINLIAMACYELLTYGAAYSKARQKRVAMLIPVVGFAFSVAVFFLGYGFSA